MIFDELGLPKDTGAEDWQDSARLAGILTVFGWPRTILLSNYLQEIHGIIRYVRHPKEYKYDMSRDQAVCLVAGFRAQGKYFLVSSSLIDGRDLLSPSVRGHFKRCQGLKPNVIHSVALYSDIMWSAYVKPEHEINQLLCMLLIAGPKWVKLFVKHHVTWRENLESYWAGWRREPELCDHMIKTIEEIANGKSN